MRANSIVRQRQFPLTRTYQENPEKAMITDVALVEGKNFDQPFHTQVCINDELQLPLRIGVHRALGGYHDLPNPGDLLCATLVACFESTLRMIANRIGIELESTLVKAEAHVDVRGTLMLDRTVPVAFQSIDLDIKMGIKDGMKRVSLLLKATEESCVIFQTFKKALPILIRHEVLDLKKA
ncbi:OsmC family protein [Pontixanthobacter gangjinensis]|uniref:OsmC family protein n=1 Tax=Christiangramia aestuarii TaxID=1028746 RepID=A0A7K1LQ21_9FLAO|nr:OsmC family protein [Christiangramia aestuarii]MUP42894.1 OsmC family protein [Christiangramia aestuarii]